MPRIFVPGPSVRPTFGSPQQFISGIADSIRGFGQDRLAKEKLASDKLFRDQTLAAGKRKQDFVEGADQRAEDKRVLDLARDNEKTTTVQNLSKGAQFAGGDRFTGIDDQLRQDPRFNNLDEAGQLAARNKFILDNPSSITPPKQFAEVLEAGLIQSGQFTGAEIAAAVQAEVAERYPTADKSIIEKLLLKPKDLSTAGSNNVTIGGKIFPQGKGGNFSLVADPTNPTERGTVVDRITDTFGLEANPSTIPLLGTRLDIGNLDATKQDVAQGVGFLSSNGANSPTAQEAAFNLAFNDDGTVKDKYNWKTKAGREALLAEAKKAQATEERIFNKKGGDISASGQAGAAGIFAPADLANATFEHNQKLLSRLTPQALSDSGLSEAFLNSLGEAPVTPRQGSGGGGVIAPEVAPPVVNPAAPTVADPLFAHTGVNPNGVAPVQQTPAPAVNLAETVSPQESVEKDFPPVNIGGQVPGEVVQNRIFNLLQEQAQNLEATTPQGIIRSALTEGVPAARKLINDLTPPPESDISGINIEEAAAPRANERAENLSNLTGKTRAKALTAAKKLLKEGKISRDDAGIAGTLNEKLLVAYRKYLEGNRN